MDKEKLENVDGVKSNEGDQDSGSTLKDITTDSELSPVEVTQAIKELKSLSESLLAEMKNLKDSYLPEVDEQAKQEKSEVVEKEIEEVPDEKPEDIAKKLDY